MARGPASLLTAEGTHPGGTTATRGTRRGPLRRALTGFRDSCALCAVALLGCLALVAAGTVVSLAWALLGDL
jgi:hypothetical protein